jgi:hypothetical protein
LRVAAKAAERAAIASQMATALLKRTASAATPAPPPHAAHGFFEIVDLEQVPRSYLRIALAEWGRGSDCVRDLRSTASR